MANKKNQKLKLLYLANIFLDKTDPRHGVTMSEILDVLAQHGVVTERKSVYSGINALREAGWDIRKCRNAVVDYRLYNRPLSGPEVVLLIDSTLHSRCLSESEAQHLIDQLVNLAPDPLRTPIMEHMASRERPEYIDTDTLKSLDETLESAYFHKRLSFRYFHYGTDGSQVFENDGEPILATPIKLIYENLRYHLVAFVEESDTFKSYRLDHMRDVELSCSPATDNDRIASAKAEMRPYTPFGSITSKMVPVTMLVAERAIDDVMDKFGTDVRIYPSDDGRARCHVHVDVCPAFFGWLIEHAGAIALEKPKRVADTYRKYVAVALKAIDDERKDHAERETETELATGQGQPPLTTEPVDGEWMVPEADDVGA